MDFRALFLDGSEVSGEPAPVFTAMKDDSARKAQPATLPPTRPAEEGEPQGEKVPSRSKDSPVVTINLLAGLLTLFHGPVAATSQNPDVKPLRNATNSKLRPNVERATARTPKPETISVNPQSGAIIPLPTAEAKDLLPFALQFQLAPQSPETDSSGEQGDHPEIGSAGVVQAGGFAQQAQPVAFQARVVDPDVAEAPAEDVFVHGGSTKPVAPAKPAIPAAAPDFGFPGAAGREAVPHREASHAAKPGTPSPAPEAPETEAPAAREAALASHRIDPVAAIAHPPGETSSKISDVRADAPQAPASEPVEPTATEVQPDAKPATPVHDLSLRLTSDAHHVDVKLTDRGGEIHVAVKSADPVLTSDLRASLHELVGGLEKSGFHAEAWHSGPAHAGSDTGSDFPRSTTRVGSDNPAGSGDASQQQSGHDARRQGRGAYEPVAPLRRNRPANAIWLSEMASLHQTEKES